MEAEQIAQKIVKIFDTVIKDVNVETKTVTAVVSTNKEDRHGDVVTPESFKKRMKLYKDHPVLLSSHNYGKLTNQIGEAKKVTITESGLEMQFEYYINAGNPEADWAWVLAQKKIAAFSIGFMGHQFEWIREKDKETGNEYVTGRKFTDVELLEVSQVLIPANRQAIQERSAIHAEESKLSELAVKEFGDKFPEMPKEAKKKDAPADDKPADTEVRSHYSENVLEDGQKANSLSNEDVLKGAVKDAAKSALQ